ncbi:MAG: ADP-ribosylglycohydrolase family protein [Aquificota bacterium]|nr:ADP-ribosylglycohydrolase family protein [Aquificota bacterium]
MKTVQDKFIGTVLGGALGDAIGKCVEEVVEDQVYEFYGGRVEGFVQPHPSSPAYGQLPEETSDETTPVRILMESLTEKKALDVRDYLERLIDWYRNETTHRYPDPILLASLEILSRGENPSSYGIVSSSVEGVLRSVVMGLFHYYNPDLAAEGAKVVSLLTHRSEAVLDGASVLGACIAYLVLEEFDLRFLDERVAFLNTLKRYTSKSSHRKVIEEVQRLIHEGADLDTAIYRLGNGSFVFEALPLSLFIFLSNIENPMEGFWWGVNSYGSFGGDTDSIGFLVGSMIGAYFGAEVFPAHLIEDLENASYYEDLAKRLYDITEKMIIRR